MVIRFYLEGQCSRIASQRKNGEESIWESRHPKVLYEPVSGMHIGAHLSKARQVRTWGLITELWENVGSF